ncbi:methyltransferase type 12 [Acidobacteria bacterium Mor1]|nr:methyltransferase type 12 [Acidobacteria bacterium Mor1]
MSDDAFETNREAWNRRTAIHLESKFYDVDAFRKGACSLNEIEKGILGDVRGRRILHLQCHFGQDSLSLARLGAKVTGVDLSDAAIRAARGLNDEMGLDAEFVCCDLYSLPDHLDGEFDRVYTSYGVLGWLPDMDRWAEIVRRYLAPGGKLLLIEFHPLVWMWDEKLSFIEEAYFNRGPLRFTQQGTYTDGGEDQEIESVGWNHGLGEVVTALLKQGLRLERLEEFDYSPYDCFEKVVKVAERKYRLEPFGDKLPLVYALEASREG